MHYVPWCEFLGPKKCEKMSSEQTFNPSKILEHK